MKRPRYGTKSYALKIMRHLMQEWARAERSVATGQRYSGSSMTAFASCSRSAKGT